MSWNCSMCSHFAAPTLKAVIRHIGAVHSHDAFFHVYCGIEGCPRTYKSFHSYKKHMYSKHRYILDISQPAIPPPINPVTATAMENPDDEPTLEMPESQVSRKVSAALFIMKAKEVNKISQSSLNVLLQDVTTMLEQKISKLETDICRALATRGIEMDAELQSLFRKPELVKPFQGIDTEYLQRKFFREAFQLVVSTIF